MSKKLGFIRRLFSEPIPYDSQKVHKTEVLSVVSDDSGKSVVRSLCVEDEMSKQIDLNFQEVTLSNLISKGVQPHGLDLIDSSKLGVDDGVDLLAKHIFHHSSDYVQSSKTESL